MWPSALTIQRYYNVKRSLPSTHHTQGVGRHYLHYCPNTRQLYVLCQLNACMCRTRKCSPVLILGFRIQQSPSLFDQHFAFAHEVLFQTSTQLARCHTLCSSHWSQSIRPHRSEPLRCPFTTVPALVSATVLWEPSARSVTFAGDTFFSHAARSAQAQYTLLSHP